MAEEDKKQKCDS